MEKDKVMGVNKGKPMKNSSKSKIIRKKKRFNLLNKIPGIIKYLKSDFHLYSHLISSTLLSDYSGSFDAFSSFTGVHKNEPVLRSKRKLKENVVEYLKSDTYLYAPLGDTQHHDDVAVKNVISRPKRQEFQFTRVTSEILSAKIAWQTKQIAQDAIVEKLGDHGFKGDTGRKYRHHSPQVREVNKQAARRSNRLSAVSG